MSVLAGLASRYQISKYPTLKVFRFGQPTKREYRGQRSVESLSNYIEDQLQDPVVRVSDLNELETLAVSHLQFFFGKLLLLGSSVVIYLSPIT
jgi:hypothetical protein